ncbi:hypothetical protein N2152v2_000703 [Parachlorella kessleri]
MDFLNKLQIAPIIGPAYACTALEPALGPVAGGFEVLIKGMRFREGKVQVKFASSKGELIVDGSVISAGGDDFKIDLETSEGLKPCPSRLVDLQNGQYEGSGAWVSMADSLVLGDAENLHRSEHLLVSVSEDELLLFGGEQDGQLLDDIYLIDEKGEELLMNDSFLFELRGTSVHCHPTQSVGELPPPRKGAIIQWRCLFAANNEPVAQALHDLEFWVARQVSGLDLAANPDSLQQNFDKLLKVMDAIYSTRVKRRETDILFDSMKEMCGLLTQKYKVNMTKAEKQLDELRGRWELLKKKCPQVRSSLASLQEIEARRIAHEIERFNSAVVQALRDFEAMNTELRRLKELGKLFGCSGTINDESISRMMEELVMAKDVWDTASAVLHQIEEWNITLWDKLQVDAIDDGARQLVKDVAALNKDIKDRDCFKGLSARVKNYAAAIPLIKDLRSPAMRPRHWEALMAATKVTVILGSELTLGELLKLELHKFEDEVVEIVDRSQKEEKLEAGLQKLEETWATIDFVFTPHRSGEVCTVKLSEEDFDILEDNQVQVQDFSTWKNAVRCCSQEGLLKTLETQQAELEMCEKALADYMESKRRIFPRFYFVSTADLLDILSNGNNPAHVQMHMSKCFQAIEKLILTPEPHGVRPTALAMESCVGTETVDFKVPLLLEGKVEEYMAKIVDVMRKELRRILKESVQDYPSKPREQWLFDWPSQIILVVNQIFWITIDAHSRDIVQNIIDVGATDPDCFQWASQLRFYWDTAVGDCRIKICDATFPYGYEYLGNGARLVITPLTDRIYVTATQACWLNMGTAPAGPAGTGKTETTKDLSAQLGKSCYVFNCAPEMDYRTMGGLEYVGKDGVKHAAIMGYTFISADGVEMPLEEGTSAFITMNPGYIGRAELPESLKALAKKFAALYYLLEDLLSPQKHYDWGLRAIKSVLVVAGGLLRGQEGQDEQDVLYRALRDFNIPKILSQDMVVFMGLLYDIFPGVDPPRQRDLSFENTVRQTAIELGLEPEEEFVRQVVQLSELLAIRHCVFLMGPTGTGRTEVYRVLAKAITAGCADPINPYIQANNKKKWIILDGDLDANWIESMNSVMDDNRLLTLPSNERIRLLPHMKLIFEIRDLKAYAKAAKWSDPEVPLKYLRELFSKYVPATILEMKKSFQHIVPLGTMNWVTTLLNILEGLIKPENLPGQSEQAVFELAFVFSAVWAFGGALCEKDGINYRQVGTVFDYYVAFKAGGKFAPWSDLVQDITYDPSVPMSQVFVPTSETVSLRFFLDMMIQQQKPIMFVGGPGVGKTQLVKGKLASLPDDMASQVISFNYFTDMLEAPLEKKSGNTFAPPGNKQLIYFLGVTRLFMTLAVEFPQQDSLMKIYGTFLTSHLRKFDSNIQELGTKLLQAALALHEKVATTFRKTAVNFHYEFTVRHLANVFQDLQAYAKLATMTAKKFFPELSDVDDYYKKANSKPLIFCNFGGSDQKYAEVKDFNLLSKRLNEGEGIMFLLTDSQIIDERMLVYVNDLLASGEIPDLYPTEDKDEIINALRGECKALGRIDTNDNCWRLFIERTERRNVYATPKTYMELIKLYKNMLKKKRQEVLDNMARLQNGLEKLHKTRSDVDVLVKLAGAKAEEVEQKVQAADAVAVEVGKEKELASTENAAAMIEADKCAIIAKDVSELQARCEGELAAAAPLVAQAEAALNTLNKKDLGVDDITAVVLCLLENVPKDKSWGAAVKLMNNVDAFITRLKGFKPLIDKGEIPKKSVDACRSYLELPHFNRETIEKKSKAAAGLCEWAINIVKYYDVYITVEPKRLELAEANAKLEAANTQLREVEEKVSALNMRVNELEEKFAKAAAEKSAASMELESCQRRLGLANRLITALASEGERWQATVGQLEQEYKVLVDDATVAGWAINWIKEKEATNGLISVRMGQPDLLRLMESAISEGKSVIIENMGESIDAILNPVITRATFKKSLAGALGLKIQTPTGEGALQFGDTYITLHSPESIAMGTLCCSNFKLFLHTKLGNPHYPPEIQAETTLINFTVTESGLEDQLLALVVNKERPDLEETKAQLIIQNTEFTIKLKQLMDNLLNTLSSAEGDLTENVALIESLEQSKALADEISEKVVEARETELQINAARDVYRPVAARGSMLFFLLNALSKIHAFYQFSLGGFVTVFSRGIDLAPGGTTSKQTVTLEALSRRVTAQQLDFGTVMDMARRTSQMGGERMSHMGDIRMSHMGDLPPVESARQGSVDAKVPELTPELLDLRLKALLETCTYVDGKINPEEFEMLCKCPRAASAPPRNNDTARWLSDSAWAALHSLIQLPVFSALVKDIEKNNDDWERWATNCEVPPEAAPMPGESAALGDFHRVLIIRAMKPDRVPSALQIYCEKLMGSKFVNQDAFKAEVLVKESTPATPMFFILFPGYSPSKEVEAYARLVSKTTENAKFTLISMGQGQEAVAEQTLDKYTKEGGWVFLDNGWISNLERKLEIAAESAHPEFRCFFSAEPILGAPQAKIIPESILQNCLKVSNEPPSEEKKLAVKSILFGLCFFHSLLLGRKKFGIGIGLGAGSGLGFNRGYSFNTGDLTTCGDVLVNYIESKAQVPWEDLRYMFGEIFYGGHITDDQDRRLCNTYLSKLIHGDLLALEANAQPALELAPGFRPPAPANYALMKEYIEKSLPAESPTVYGLHSNAQLSLLSSQADTLFKTIIEVTVGGGGAGGNQAMDNVASRLDEYMQQLPPLFNIIEIETRVKERTPYINVALQEVTRMNALLGEMKRSMEELRLGLDGALNFSPAMEALSSAIAQDKDVLKRYNQLAQWTSGNIELPKSVWLPGLFMPKAFLTAIMQVSARWDTEGNCIADSYANELHPTVPVIWCRPMTLQDYSLALKEETYYECPVYINMQRANVYSPLISVFTLRTKEPASKWTLASVALLMQDELS